MKIFSNIKQNLFILCVCFLGGVLTINKSYSYVISNLNNTIFTYIQGDYRFSYSYNLNREIVYYQSAGLLDNISRTNVSANYSRLKVADPFFLHNKNFFHFFAFDLGTEILLYPDWTLIAQLRGAFSSDNNKGLYPSIAIISNKFGTLEYYQFKRSDPFSTNYSLNIRSLLTTHGTLGNGSLTYTSPDIDLKNENSLSFRVSYVFNPKLYTQRDNFTNGLSYNLIANRFLGYVYSSSQPVSVDIKSNYNFYVDYDQYIKGLHAIKLSASYDVIDYSIYNLFTYDNRKNYNQLFGNANEKLFKISIGYNFGEFSTYYIYGSTNATTNDDFIFVSTNNTTQTHNFYSIRPKLNGSLHVFKARYSPYSLDNKLIINGLVEIYHDKVTNGNDKSLLPVSGIKASIKGNSAKLYSVSFTYKFNKNLSVSFTSTLQSNNTDFNTITNGKYNYFIDQFNNRLSLSAGF